MSKNPIVIEGLGPQVLNYAAVGGEAKALSIDFLRREVRPNLVLTVRNADETEKDVTFQDFFAEFDACEQQQSSSSQRVYLKDSAIATQFPWLFQQHVRVPKYFLHCFKHRTRERTLHGSAYVHPSLFLGNKGSKTALHIDPWPTNFWCYLVEGEKKWTLFHPDDAHLLHPTPTNEEPPYSFPSVEKLGELEKSWPLSRPRARKVEFVLKAGEVLFNAAQTPHEVANLTRTLMVCGLFIDQSNLTMCLAHTRRILGKMERALAEKVMAEQDVQEVVGEKNENESDLLGRTRARTLTSGVALYPDYMEAAQNVERGDGGEGGHALGSAELRLSSHAASSEAADDLTLFDGWVLHNAHATRSALASVRESGKAGAEAKNEISSLRSQSRLTARATTAVVGKKEDPYFALTEAMENGTDVLYYTLYDLTHYSKASSMRVQEMGQDLIPGEELRAEVDLDGDGAMDARANDNDEDHGMERLKGGKPAAAPASPGAPVSTKTPSRETASSGTPGSVQPLPRPLEATPCSVGNRYGYVQADMHATTPTPLSQPTTGTRPTPNVLIPDPSHLPSVEGWATDMIESSAFYPAYPLPRLSYTSTSLDRERALWQRDDLRSQLRMPGIAADSKLANYLEIMMSQDCEDDAKNANDSGPPRSLAMFRNHWRRPGTMSGGGVAPRPGAGNMLASASTAHTASTTANGVGASLTASSSPPGSSAPGSTSPYHSTASAAPSSSSPNKSELKIHMISRAEDRFPSQRSVEKTQSGSAPSAGTGAAVASRTATSGTVGGYDDSLVVGAASSSKHAAKGGGAGGKPGSVSKKEPVAGTTGATRPAAPSPYAAMLTKAQLEFRIYRRSCMLRALEEIDFPDLEQDLDYAETYNYVLQKNEDEDPDITASSMVGLFPLHAGFRLDERTRLHPTGVAAPASPPSSQQAKSNRSAAPDDSQHLYIGGGAGVAGGAAANKLLLPGVAPSSGSTFYFPVSGDSVLALSEHTGGPPGGNESSSAGGGAPSSTAGSGNSAADSASPAETITTVATTTANAAVLPLYADAAHQVEGMDAPEAEISSEYFDDLELPSASAGRLQDISGETTRMSFHKPEDFENSDSDGTGGDGYEESEPDRHRDATNFNPEKRQWPRSIADFPAHEVKWSRAYFVHNFKTRWWWWCAILPSLAGGIVLQAMPKGKYEYMFWIWADASDGTLLIVWPAVWIFMMILERPLLGYSDYMLADLGYDVFSRRGRKDLKEYRRRAGCCGFCLPLRRTDKPPPSPTGAAPGSGPKTSDTYTETSADTSFTTFTSGAPDGARSGESAAPLVGAPIGISSSRRSSAAQSNNHGSSFFQEPETRGESDEEDDGAGRQVELDTLLSPRRTNASDNAPLEANKPKTRCEKVCGCKRETSWKECCLCFGSGLKTVNRRDLLARDRCCCCQRFCPVCTCGSLLRNIPKTVIFFYLAYFIFTICISPVFVGMWLLKKPDRTTTLLELFDETPVGKAYSERSWVHRDGRTWPKAYYNRVDTPGGSGDDPREFEVVLKNEAEMPKKFLSDIQDKEERDRETDTTAHPDYGTKYTKSWLNYIHRKNNWVPRKGWPETIGSVAASVANKTDAWIAEMCAQNLERLNTKGWQINRIDHKWLLENNFPTFETDTTEDPETAAATVADELASPINVPGENFKRRVASAHRADRVRLAILGRYGGIYSDATVIWTNPFEFLVRNVAPSPEWLERTVKAREEMDQRAEKEAEEGADEDKGDKSSSFFSLGEQAGPERSSDQRNFSPVMSQGPGGMRTGNSTAANANGNDININARASRRAENQGNVKNLQGGAGTSASCCATSGDESETPDPKAKRERVTLTIKDKSNSQGHKEQVFVKRRDGAIGRSRLTMLYTVDQSPKLYVPFIVTPDNWFLAAPPANLFLAMWNSELWTAYARWKGKKSSRDQYLWYKENRFEHYECADKHWYGMVSYRDGGDCTQYHEGGCDMTQYMTSYLAAQFLLEMAGVRNGYEDTFFTRFQSQEERTILRWNHVSIWDDHAVGLDLVQGGNWGYNVLSWANEYVLPLTLFIRWPDILGFPYFQREHFYPIRVHLYKLNGNPRRRLRENMDKITIRGKFYQFLLSPLLLERRYDSWRRKKFEGIATNMDNSKVDVVVAGATASDKHTHTEDQLAEALSVPKPKPTLDSTPKVEESLPARPAEKSAEKNDVDGLVASVKKVRHGRKAVELAEDLRYGMRQIVLQELLHAISTNSPEVDSCGCLDEPDHVKQARERMESEDLEGVGEESKSPVARIFSRTYTSCWCG
eukprot:g3785.t1